MKPYLKLTGSLIVNQIISSVMAFISFPIYFVLNGPLGVVVTGVFPTIVLFSLIYSVLWQEGFRDPNKVKLGQIEYSPYKGFIICALSFIPSFILLIISFFSKNFILKIIYFVFGFYSQSFSFMFPNTYIFINLAIILLAIIISGTSYLLGYKRISLYHKIVYKKAK